MILNNSLNSKVVPIIGANNILLCHCGGKRYIIIPLIFYLSKNHEFNFL